MNSETAELLLRKKCYEVKYYNSIKFMIHNTFDDEQRIFLLKIVFECDPFLGAKIYSSMCDDSDEVIMMIHNSLDEHRRRAHKELRKMRLLLAYLELELHDKFYSYFAEVSDSFGSKEYNFILKNCNFEKNVFLVDAMMQCNNLKGLGYCIRRINRYYSRENDTELWNIIKILEEYHKFDKVVEIITATGNEARFYEKYKEKKDDCIKVIENLGITNMYTYLAYVGFKYGFLLNDSNDNETISKVLQELELNTTEKYVEFLKKLVINNALSVENQLLILYKLNLSEKLAHTVVNNHYFEEFISKVKKKNHIDDWVVEYGDFESQARIIKESIDSEEYAFSCADTRSINNAPNRGVNRIKEYELFERFMEDYCEATEIVHIYFNSILRYRIDVEFLIMYLKKRFSLDEKRIKTLFGDYIIYGRITRVNENSVSIRSKNILTSNPCRMNTRNCWVVVNGEKITLKRGDCIYYKINYLAENAMRINVHFPAMTLDEMREIEQRRKKT